MDPLTSTAASGLRSNLEALDLLANNLANIQTNGFKNDREFYDLYSAAEAGEAGAYDPTKMPVIEKNWTDYAQGSLKITENPTDLAISGPGFFTVAGPSGPLYTRNGEFQFTSAGRLVTEEGYPLQGIDGKPIQLDPSQKLDVSPTGELRQGGQLAGTVQAVSFARTSDLSKRGATLFRLNGPAASVGPASGQILQGKLESSNVGVAESTVRMITIMRQFEMLQKAVLIGAEMNTAAIQSVSKSGA